jgi:hypothetical protein
MTSRRYRRNMEAMPSWDASKHITKPPGSRPLDAVEGAERAHRSRPARDVAADAYLVIRCDGLLRAGANGVQLTWMDARIGDHVVTPRAGNT